MTYNVNLLAYAGDGAGEASYLFIPVQPPCWPPLSAPLQSVCISTSVVLLAWPISAPAHHIRW